MQQEFSCKSKLEIPAAATIGQPTRNPPIPETITHETISFGFH
jgi:hypothetical protein